MSKALRNKMKRLVRTDRRNTVVSKETNPNRMNNPANAKKARELGKKESPQQED